jgi:hypothetical protein
MHEGPEFRIVGSAPEEEKQKVREKYKAKLFDHFNSLKPEEQAELRKSEYPKSPEDLALIDWANEETNRLMVEAGVEPYDVPYENFHIIPSDTFKKIKGDENTTANATTQFSKQGIMFDAKDFRSNPVYFGAVLIHELLHLKGHYSIEVEEKPNGAYSDTSYREGLGIYAAQKLGFHGKFHRHFVGLHEAVVSTQEGKSLQSMLELALLKEEKDRLASEDTVKLKERISKSKKIPVEDILWVGKSESEYETVNYRPQRRVLSYVCVEICKEFHDQFSSSEEVFKEFLNAQFTGKLLPIARLVEKTFGEGSFRLLGNMTTQNGQLYLESFQKARLHASKAKTI